VILAIGAIGSLGSQWSISPVGGLGSPGQVAAPSGTSSSGGGFAGALTKAMDGLQQGQDAADAASQGLATGKVTDPTQAITAVSNAQLEMELASQLTSKGISDVQTIFQTQV
jgi:flagellar hook-basal body complex protein FliE